MAINFDDRLCICARDKRLVYVHQKATLKLMDLTANDFVRVLAQRDDDETIQVLRGICNLDVDPRTNFIRKYILADPSLASLLKTLPRILQTTDHDYMCCIVSLVGHSLKELLDHPRFKATRIITTVMAEHSRIFYRCLSSGNPNVLGAAIFLLSVMAKDIPSVIIENLDFSHKGFLIAARTRRTPSLGKLPSPRQNFVEFLATLIEKGDFEARTILSRSAFLFHYIVKDLNRDYASTVKRILTCLLERIVFNEENNHNIAVAFFKNQISHLSQLLYSNSLEICQVAEEFFTRSFSLAGKGLCYPVDGNNLGFLRNRLLLDFVVSLKFQNDEHIRSIVLGCLQNGPDAAWALMEMGKNLSLEPIPRIEYANSVNIVITLLSRLPPAADHLQVLPKSINKSALYRGISSSDAFVRLNTLLLLLALLRRITPQIKDLQAAIDLLPDFKTIYNIWKSQQLDGSEEGSFCEICFLEVINTFINGGLVNKLLCTEIFSSTDFIKCATSKEMAQAALPIINSIGPLILCRNEGLQVLEELFVKMEESRMKVFNNWLHQLGIVQPELEIAEDVPSDLVSLLLRMIQRLVTGEGLAMLEIKLDLEILSKTNWQTTPRHNPPKSPPRIAEVVAKVPEITRLNFEGIEYDDAVDLLEALLPQLKRAAIVQSYSTSESWGFDGMTWLRLLATAVQEPRALKLDWRRIIDVGLIGIPIIALSSESKIERRLSHLILFHLAHLIESSRMRERLQVGLVLGALGRSISRDDPLAKVDRLMAVFHALALMACLRPDAAIYRPINELYLISSTITPKDAYVNLMNDTNDEWSRCLFWCLNWIDVSVGREGEFYQECRENIEKLHVAENVATLLQGRTPDKGCRALLEKLLKKFTDSNNNVGKAQWMQTFLDFIEP